MKQRKTIISYLAITGSLFIFQYIYHLFSHGIVSSSLHWVWLVPLIGGSGVVLFSNLLGTLKNRLAFNLYNSGLASCATGMILKGILEISGTSSPYLFLYLTVGIVFIGISIFLFIIHRLMDIGTENSPH